MNETVKSIQVGRHTFSPIVVSSNSSPHLLFATAGSHLFNNNENTINSSSLPTTTVADRTVRSAGTAQHSGGAPPPNSALQPLSISGVGTQPPPRPLSAYEKAGISAAPPPTITTTTAASPAPIPRVPSRGALVVSATEDAAFQPTLPWYESHLFYAKKKAVKKSAVSTKSRASMSVAAEGGGDGNAALCTAESATVVVDESQGTFDDSFFNKIGGAGGAVGPSGRPRSFIGPYAQRTQEIMDAFEAKGGPPAALKPLTAFHRNLSLHVDVSGMVLLTDVAGFLVELVPAMEQEKFGSQVVTPWLRRLLLGSNSNPLREHDGPSSPVLMTTANGSQSSSSHPASPNSAVLSPPTAFDLPGRSNSLIGTTTPQLPYCNLFDTLVSLFADDRVVRRCFDLCDLTRCGYILKDALRALRNEPTGSFVLSGGGSLGMVVTAPPELTCHVVKGAWRIFERIAAAEDAALSGGDKKKKKKGSSGGGGGGAKGGQGSSAGIGTKRQFHASFAEFTAALREDGHIALAFVPFVLKRDLESLSSSGAAGTSSQ